MNISKNIFLAGLFICVASIQANDLDVQYVPKKIQKVGRNYYYVDNSEQDICPLRYEAKFKNPLSTGVPALDDLEMSKLSSYELDYLKKQANKFSDFSEFKFSDKEMMIIQRLIGKGMGLGMRIGMTLSSLEAQYTSKQGNKVVVDHYKYALAINKLLLNVFKNDKELTGFVTYPICCLAEQAQTLLEQDKDLDKLTEELIGYAPQVDDLFTVLLKYDAWSRAYLKQQYEQNGLVTVDDIYFVAISLVEYFNFPEPSAKIWKNLMLAVLQGAKELDKEVLSSISDMFAAWLQNQDFEEFLAAAASANEIRQQSIQKAKVEELTQDDLDQYSKELDQVLAYGHMFEGALVNASKHVSGKIALVEKFVFKNS